MLMSTSSLEPVPTFLLTRGKPRLALLLAVPGVFVAGVIAAIVIPLLAARADLTQARSALSLSREHVKQRKEGLAADDLARASRAIAAAMREAHRPSMRIVRPIPLLGSPGRAVEGAALAAKETVAAGHVLLGAASSFPGSADVSVDGHDLSKFATAAASSRTALAEAKRHLVAAHRALNGPAGAALPPVSGPARAMRKVVSDTTRQFDGAARGLDLLSRLAAPNGDYKLLLLSQDSMEIRPTGGYIGSFGVIHFFHGTVELEKYQSFEDLPQPKPAIEAPQDLAVALDERGWRIENVNWWPNFPNSAAAARDMYARQGGDRVDGVIAMTENVMARIVGALGPFQVPGYAKPVTEQGFDKRVLYEVELKKPHDNPRKQFLTLLSDMVFQRLFHPKADEIPKIVKAIDASVGAGDLQAWFADPAMQRNVSGTAWSGELPKTTNDFLMLTEANLTAGKANADLTRHATYQVHRDKNGHLIAHLNVVFRNDGDKSSINEYYNGHLRIYVPKDAKLDEGDRSIRDDGVAPDAPYRVFTRNVYVLPHEQQVVDVTYRLPDSVAPGGNYQLTWLRQPGTTRDALQVVAGDTREQADAAQRKFDLRTSLSHHRIREALHGSWVFRKLGF
jgi:hypothetical protein